MSFFEEVYKFLNSLMYVFSLLLFLDTTRKPRSGEEHGKDYYFTTREEMERMIENGDFIEYAKFGENLYGTSKKAVSEIQSSGKICVLDLELQGVRNIKKTDLDPKYILIRAPTIDILVSLGSGFVLFQLSLSLQRQRLNARGSESPESLEVRLKHAEEDLEAVRKDPALFDYVIVNDNLETAYQEFIEAIKDELDAVQKCHQNGA